MYTEYLKTLSIYTSVTAASRRITRDLCSFVFDAARLNDIFEILNTISMHDYPGNSLDASQSDYFEIWLLIYIHMTLLKISYSESAYLFTNNTLGSKSLGTF